MLLFYPKYVNTGHKLKKKKKRGLTVASSQRGWGSVYGHRWLWMSGPVKVIRMRQGRGQRGFRGRRQELEV